MKKTSTKIIVSILLAVVLWSGVNYNEAFGLTGVDLSRPVPTAIGSQGQKDMAVASENTSQGKYPTANIAARTPEERRTICLQNGPMEPVALQQCISRLIQEENPDKGIYNSEFMKMWGKNAVNIFTEGIAKTTAFVLGVFVQLILVPVSAALFRISGFILDASVSFTLNSSNLGGGNGVGIKTAIETVWVIVRDIFNITFIFILLYTAIKTIIGSASANTKKTLANVIIAALLINFSLLITRVVIDAGNITAISLYRSIGGGVDIGIGTLVMKALGLTGFWNFGGASLNGITTGLFIISTLQFIVLIVGFIVFIYAALLMIARTVTLIFLMATSPLGFMGDILPSISEYSKMWRTNLFGQVFVAPIFLLFVMLIIKVGEKITTASVTRNPGETDYVIYFKFILVIMLLVIAVKTTKKMSGVVGGAVEKFGAMAAGAAIGIATGGAAFALRGTIGRGANALATSQGLKDASVSDNMFKRWGAKATMAVGGGVSKRSFDVRNISAVSDFTKKQLGVDIKEGAFGTKFGSAGKGGYAGRISEQEKDAEAKAKELTKGIKASEQEITDGVAEKRSELARLRVERDRLKSINNRSDDDNAKLKEYETTIKSFAGLDDNKFKKKIESEIEEKKKEKRLEAAAKLEAGIDWEKKLAGTPEGKSITGKVGRVVNSVMGGNKEKAKKLRDAYKKKDTKAQLWETFQKASEENKEEEKPAAPPPPPPPPTTPAP